MYTIIFDLNSFYCNCAKVKKKLIQKELNLAGLYITEVKSYQFSVFMDSTRMKCMQGIETDFYESA